MASALFYPTGSSLEELGNNQTNTSGHYQGTPSTRSNLLGISLLQSPFSILIDANYEHDHGVPKGSLIFIYEILRSDILISGFTIEVQYTKNKEYVSAYSVTIPTIRINNITGNTLKFEYLGTTCNLTIDDQVIANIGDIEILTPFNELEIDEPAVLQNDELCKAIDKNEFRVNGEVYQIFEYSNYITLDAATINE